MLVYCRLSYFHPPPTLKSCLHLPHYVLSPTTAKCLREEDKSSELSLTEYSGRLAVLLPKPSTSTSISGSQSPFPHHHPRSSSVGSHGQTATAIDAALCCQQNWYASALTRGTRTSSNVPDAVHSIGDVTAAIHKPRHSLSRQFLLYPKTKPPQGRFCLDVRLLKPSLLPSSHHINLLCLCSDNIISKLYKLWTL